MNTFKWLVRREFWENRAIWIAPAAVGALQTLAILFGTVNISGITDNNALATPDQGTVIGGLALFIFGVVFFAVAYVYAFWYLLDCLYADRKDRSILFWKSLPITDAQTVLAKLFIGLIAIPLVYFVAADVTTLLMAVIVSLRFRSFIGAALWHPDQWLQMQVLWLYLIVTMGIWYLPLAGWFMVVSAWARRAVILWSILPPVAILILERWFVGTHVVARLLVDWSSGYAAHTFIEPPANGWATAIIGGHAITRPESIWGMVTPAYFFSSPATWICIFVGSALVFAAIQLRLRRAEV
jgi:ABC-2 type transport system permease protein